MTTYIRFFFYYLLLFCVLGFPCHAGAQVAGNKFQELVLDKNTAISIGSNVTITAKTTNDEPAGDLYPNTIQKAFDGNRETWWTSSKAGTVYIYLTFNAPVTLSGFHIYGGGSTTQRESWVNLEVSSDGSSWTRIKHFENNRDLGRDNDYVLDQTVTAKYVRLHVVPAQSANTLAMNEITLYSGFLSSANTEIMHKSSKWHDLRKGISESAKSLDRFNDEKKMFLLQDSVTEVQAAHTYMDTIYVHKGTSVNLVVPDQLKQIIDGKVDVTSSVMSYQRWYSFRTDRTFRTQNTGVEEVWDLLTPPDSTIKPYRMANGYVAKPITSKNLLEMTFYVPTDDEFREWFGDDYVKKYDNNYYLVACDVSGYTDYTKEYSITTSGQSQFYPSNQPDGKSYEPTLTHRVVYYIQTVDNRDTGMGDTPAWREGMKRLKDPAYQGGTDDGKYLEEYEISFPFTRVSNHTLELVALSKDAGSYSIPDVKAVENSKLDVRLGGTDNTAGIRLNSNSTSLSGTSRVIHFEYPHTNTADQTQYVNAENSTATIYVTKTVNGTTYNIAKYNLKFVRNTRLLTQTQLKQIEDGTIQDENLKYYQFRTDKYLSENYTLLTQLNFDYDQAVGDMYGQDGYYPFPLEWDASSYSFFDGSEGQDYDPSKDGKYYPEWGYYAITKWFMESKYWGSSSVAEPLPGSTYHLYVDASDRAGVIARLPFRKDLCPGSEMFVTAWVKSAVNNPKNQSDAGMLFSVMGVTKDKNTGQDLYVPIYRHATGQIRRTDYLSGMPGTGAGNNEWMQMYFSFIIDSDVQFESYVLQVDNNSASTLGGDMYIDDIRAYLATPSAKVSQLEATCTNERTLMSIEMDWDRLLSRLGDVEGANEIEGIDFCFVDQAKYEAYLAQHPGDYANAISAAVVEIGNNEEGEDFYNEKYNTLYFDLTFENNTSCDGLSHPYFPKGNKVTEESEEVKYFFYRTDKGAGQRALTVDFYSELTPNRSYLMLVQINDGNQASVEDFAESIDDACAIVTPFYVTAQSLLRVNGEVVDPTTDFCAGQVFSFSAQVRVPKRNEDGTGSYITIDKGVYFDWFFGSEEEYLAERTEPEYEGESLQHALATFRDIYPDKENLEGVTAGDHVINEQGQTVYLSQKAIDLIDHYVNAPGPEEGMNNRLVLHREELDITLLASGLQLVVQPIPILMLPGSGIDEELLATVCWSHIPLQLNASGAAPQVRAGFNALEYPSDEFNPGLRIGLGQIQELSVGRPLKVSLRGATLVTEGADHLGLITSASPDVFNKIYLIDTNDPAYKNETFFPADFSEFSLPVGSIKSLHAEPYATGSDFNDYMEIYFDTKTVQSNGFRFNPKEGYFYKLAFHFEEKMEEGTTSANSCFGVFNMDMKVVPEYLVWNASGADGNWNNDDNWKRADKKDLKKAETDEYPTNEENTTANGYVPMLFSNVIMPRGSKAELYMAGFTDFGNSWVNTSRPEHMLPPTKDIQYDLMTYDNQGNYSAERYRVNICGDIHFEPGAQMLHVEQLIYNKAWIDVEMLPGKWNAVSVPLYGVVAGDWYAPKANGRQETEYFKDIRFADGGYNRLNPAVYQRSWGTGATIVENTSGGGDTQNVPVSFTADWSSVYNDAAVPYTAGGGFSVKGILNQGQPQTQTPLLFRFPKADESYEVATGTLNRKNAGKLLVDSMMLREDPNNYNHPDEAFTTLYPSANGAYLMVGNPFMAPMDIQAFMNENSDRLQQKYWLDPSLEEAQAVVLDPEKGWSAGPHFADPYTVFYVAAIDPEEAKSGVKIKFTPGMQTFDTDGAAGEDTPETFRIEALDDYGKSMATLSYSPSADNLFRPEEDAELIQNLDGNGRQVPMVYTVAGDRAVSANLIKDNGSVPLGVFAAEGSPVTIVFQGVEALNNAVLYDAELRTETRLNDGYSLAVNGSSHGRFFIRTNGADTDHQMDKADDLSVYSVMPKQIIVSSGAPLGEITVWSTDGTLIQKVRPDGNVCTLNGISSGVVLVKIQAETPVVRKVVVK